MRGASGRPIPSALDTHRTWRIETADRNEPAEVRLDSRFPEYAKLTYWFPSVFVIGFYLSLVLLIFAQDLPLKLYFIYFFLVFVFSTIRNKSFKIGFLSIIAVWRQFMGYGHGFIESFIKVRMLKKNPEKVFPELFFKS